VCGIVGYIGDADAAAVLLPALRRLEYRGYDSAGIATLNGHGLETRKAVGKIAALEAAMAARPPQGTLGIAHTRWATHGRPSLANAHPHLDCASRVAVVHNGIIENHAQLRRSLASLGHRFRSQTDTEVIAHLIEQYRSDDLLAAVQRAAADLRGAYAIACISEDTPDTLVAVRRGSSPLVIGCGDGEIIVASDIPALLGRAREMIVLGDGEIALLRRTGITIRTLGGVDAGRAPERVTIDAEAAERGGYSHFMLKEIFEQPTTLRNTLQERLDVEHEDVDIPGLRLTDREVAGLTRLTFVACGSSFHAALVGKYVMEAFARLPVDVEIASEFRYRQPVLDGRVATIPISQSGETADTLAALRHARACGSRVIAICNVVGSSVAREAHGVLYTRAGLEIGVASTKTFTAQLAAVLLLALKFGTARGMLDADLRRTIVRDLAAAPALMERTLELNGRLRTLADRFATAPSALFLGRGLNYPLALEGALKLKEISYIHAEGYAAGEMKHGPIALVDRDMPVVAVAPADSTYEKMASNIEEVKARDGCVIALTTEDDEALATRADYVVSLPRTAPCIQPLIVALPLQLLAYHAAVLRGCDVDQPRNLAKSVTVE